MDAYEDRRKDTGGGCRSWLIGCGAVAALLVVVAGGFVLGNWDRIKRLAEEVGQPIQEVMALQRSLETAYPGRFEVLAKQRRGEGEPEFSLEITWRERGHAERSEEDLEPLAREIAHRALEGVTDPRLTRKIVVRCEARRAVVSTAREFGFTREELLGEASPDTLGGGR